MEKRRILFGVYDTASDGLLTLTAYKLSAPKTKDNRISVPGMDGTLNASTSLTGGEPIYYDRTLTASFETSEGSRLERKARLDAMVNLLDGRTMDIVLPDDAEHIVRGDVHVEIAYNDNAHAKVNVSATVFPWRLRKEPTTVTLALTSEYQTLTLSNERRRVVPTIKVTEDTTLLWGDDTYAISAGTHRLLNIQLAQGENQLQAKLTSAAAGTITVTYQEASL